jgi:hypothetical protein
MTAREGRIIFQDDNAMEPELAETEYSRRAGEKEVSTVQYRAVLHCATFYFSLCVCAPLAYILKRALHSPYKTRQDNMTRTE